MAELRDKEVVLCGCHGRIAEKFPFDEIRQFLQRMSPDVQVVVADDLCQRHGLRGLAGERGSRPLVIGACPKLRLKLHFWEETIEGALSPYSINIVDLLEQTTTSCNDTEAAERVKLLLWSQIKRAGEFKGVGQGNLKLRIPVPHDKVTRREFLSAFLPQYEIVPSIESARCIGGYKCRLCHDSCPLQAVSIEEDAVTIDISICSGCGACVGVCPQGAVSYPNFSLEELDKELEGLLWVEGVSLEPRIIALTCRTCLPGYGDGEGNQLRYPPSVLPLGIPCLAMASPWLMLRAFDMGAQGLALISSKDKCRNGLDLDVVYDNIRFIQAMLGCWGIEAERTRLFEVTESNQADIQRGLGQFAREIAGLSPTLLRAVARTLTSAEAPRLPALIKHMGERLMRSPEGAISTGTVPFGKIILDAVQCTGCGLCALNCPTDALTILPDDDGAEYQLLFQHDSCVACEACVNICPEDCLELEHVLELDRLGSEASVLFRDSIVKCHRCGKPVGPKSMIDGLRVRLQQTGNALGGQLELCPTCRAGVADSGTARIKNDTHVTASNMDFAASAGAGRERTR